MAYDPSPLDTSPTTIQTIKAGGDKINENFTELPNMLADKVDKVVGKQLSTEDYTTAEKDKLAGIEAGATANATDAQLRDRTTHTGTQPHTTITGLGSSATADIGTDSGEVIGTDEAREYFDIAPRTSVQPTLSSNFARNKHERYELYGNEPKTLLQQWDVDRNSTATYFDANGVLQTAAVNQPRIDYSTGEGRLLVEGQSTNLVLRSEDFGNAYWAKFNTSILQNQDVAPDGSLTADILVENTELSSHQVERNIGVFSTGTIFSGNVFLKKQGDSDRHIDLRIGRGGPEIIRVDLSAASIVSIGDSIIHSEIMELVNGFFKISWTVSISSNSGGLVQYFNIRLIKDGDFIYQGDGTSGVYIWGAQLEQASSPSSYIKTEASQVTRLADIITPKGDA